MQLDFAGFLWSIKVLFQFQLRTATESLSFPQSVYYQKQLWPHLENFSSVNFNSDGKWKLPSIPLYGILADNIRPAMTWEWSSPTCRCTGPPLSSPPSGWWRRGGWWCRAVGRELVSTEPLSGPRHLWWIWIFSALSAVTRESQKDWNKTSENPPGIWLPFCSLMRSCRVFGVTR